MTEKEIMSIYIDTTSKQTLEIIKKRALDNKGIDLNNSQVIRACIKQSYDVGLFK